MIPEIDEALRGLLRSSLPDKGVEIAFDAPTRDWAARRNTPTVDAYLYDIREDLARRERGVVAVRDEQGIVVRRRQPPRYFRLSYLVTAWTKRAEDEHRLLAVVLGCLLGQDFLPIPEGPGLLSSLGLQVPMTPAAPPQESRSIADIWSALGGDLKPSLDLVITAPYPVGPEYPVGPAVTEGAGIRSHRLDEPETEAPLRLRRYGKIENGKRERTIERKKTEQ
ncbi:DUF4255 domain-containing protein [Catenulispora sp. NF23]|uniref:DUF4255 domain-containing protein n=1 Tax=Catenulispora pinistramenti TaxID=2705254 RepID=A0ABS5L453_9ACTN|nr:DUF4255 domain-containing protein [Catenulispora pinistramenti]MBS2537017.1 DUF4255 domain-containing protein [Catenulispora pinistramenti]MBS2553086.1 DUF4255 domain-containing protein [Catenulispora pinistramenti]